MSEEYKDDETFKQKVDRRLGSKFWMARSSHGRKPKFEDPEVLWDACVQYFEWVEQNPLWEFKVTQFQGEPVPMEIPKMRAMTKEALCLFLDICEDTWNNYKKKEDFFGVTKRAEGIIYNQKFTGASADILNANIIARDLGLKDSTETKLTHSFESMSDEELALKRKELERQLENTGKD